MDFGIGNIIGIVACIAFPLIAFMILKDRDMDLMNYSWIDDKNGDLKQ